MSAYPEKPVYIIDDEQFILQSLSAVLRSSGINNIVKCSDSRKVLGLIEETPPSIVLLDLTMPHLSGEELLPAIKEMYPDVPVLVITGVNELSTAVECMKKGASDYLVKAIENTKLTAAVRKSLSINELKEENVLLKKSLLSDDDEVDDSFKNIVTVSRSMKSVFKYLTIISRTNQTVLIRGETGTGKELTAEAVHKASGRSGAFVSVNAAGLDDAMFSDTLFGHKKGAYSGAENSRPGLIEKAAGGTLFLDEIGDLSPGSQVKLLRLLEKGEYYALGSDTLKLADCRIVAATNCDLSALMAEGSFRKDLYYRLSANEVVLPPLRMRRGDIPVLVRHFTEKTASEYKQDIPEISGSFMKKICSLELPGNVRELITIINRCFSFADDGRFTGSLLSEVKPDAADSEPAVSETADSNVFFPEELPALKEWTNLLIDEALRRTGGNITAAADILGISQPALSKRLARRR